MYIHQTENWPNFTWDQTRIGLKLAKVNKAAGFLEGRLSAIGFDVQQNWSSVGILPCVSPTDENPSGLAPKLKVKINK